MVGGCCNNIVGSGHRLGIHERARRDDPVSVVTGEARAVGIYRPEALDGARRPIDIFPTRVYYASVIEDRRREIHQVIGREAFLLLTVTVHPVDDG